ncbi:hypothetical protein L249_6614 [Ophiocordyceps polyrhachis-furcata BCC 54312]|uniref:Uncharacterized protein n=1 Tax=Ophiocordyceps polyrhachis-furcata BCC 54312 TaxID=1330021 RepID=A0A367LMA9_9HYPO|nr:hypothetical protein L249_6614 [Ophiocordyceps polyrhachis-furcata BCC 54312]
MSFVLHGIISNRTRGNPPYSFALHPVDDLMAPNGNHRSPAVRQGIRTPSSAPPGLVVSNGPRTRVRRAKKTCRDVVMVSLGRLVSSLATRLKTAADKNRLTGPVSSPILRPGLRSSRSAGFMPRRWYMKLTSCPRPMPVSSDGATSSRASRSAGKEGSFSSRDGREPEAIPLFDLKVPTRRPETSTSKERIVRVCHSYGEDLSSRTRCRKCGHDFCVKCVVKISVDETRASDDGQATDKADFFSVSTVREPQGRQALPETPKTQQPAKTGSTVRNNPFVVADQKARASASTPQTVPFARDAVRPRQLSDCVPRRFMDRTSDVEPEEEEEEAGSGEDRRHSICCAAARQNRSVRRSGDEAEERHVPGKERHRGIRTLRRLRQHAEELHAAASTETRGGNSSSRSDEPLWTEAVHDLEQDERPPSLRVKQREKPHSLEDDVTVPLPLAPRPHTLERDDVFGQSRQSREEAQGSDQSVVVVVVQPESLSRPAPDPQQAAAAGPHQDMSSLTGFPQHRRGTNLCLPAQEREAWPQLKKVDRGPVTAAAVVEEEEEEEEEEGGDGSQMWKLKPHKTSDDSPVPTPPAQWRQLLSKTRSAPSDRRHRETCSFCEPSATEGAESRDDAPTPVPTTPAMMPAALRVRQVERSLARRQAQEEEGEDGDEDPLPGAWKTESASLDDVARMPPPSPPPPPPPPVDEEPTTRRDAAVGADDGERGGGRGEVAYDDDLLGVTVVVHFRGREDVVLRATRSMTELH